MIETSVMPIWTVERNARRLLRQLQGHAARPCHRSRRAASTQRARGDDGELRQSQQAVEGDENEDDDDVQGYQGNPATPAFSSQASFYALDRESSSQSGKSPDRLDYSRTGAGPLDMRQPRFECAVESDTVG